MARDIEILEKIQERTTLKGLRKNRRDIEEDCSMKHGGDLRCWKRYRKHQSRSAGFSPRQMAQISARSIEMVGDLIAELEDNINELCAEAELPNSKAPYNLRGFHIDRGLIFF